MRFGLTRVVTCMSGCSIDLFIWEIDYIFLENKETDNLSWINSHFNYYEMAKNAVQSV